MSNTHSVSSITASDLLYWLCFTVRVYRKVYDLAVVVTMIQKQEVACVSL